MVRTRARILTRVFCCYVCMAAGAWAPAAAQSAAPPVPVPPAVLANILTGVGGAAVLDRFLRGDGAPPATVARRAAAVIRQLGAQRDRLKPEDLLGAVDRVVHVAARSLSYASVMRMAVAENYRPRNAVLAWDFGPAGGRVTPGFERIKPGDPRIAGDAMAGVAASGQNTLLKDGIAGLRRIKLNLAQGKYRIILRTQNAGDPALARLPFGREVSINGMTLIVNGDGPGSWLDNALLSDSGVRLAGGGFDRVGGFLTGAVDDEASSLYQAQQGAAIVLEGATRDGQLVIELGNFGGARSYVTGMIIEAPDRLSDLILSRNALNHVIPLDIRVALETEILLVAAESVQGIAPAAGQAFRSQAVVTAN